MPSAALDVVPRLLRAFRVDYPDVKLMLNGDTTSQQIAALMGETTDLGIVVPPLHDASDLRVENLCEQELMLAVPRHTRSAASGACSFATLPPRPSSAFPSRKVPASRAWSMAACQKSGFIPNFVQVASQMQTILALVAGGGGSHWCRRRCSRC